MIGSRAQITVCGQIYATTVKAVNQDLITIDWPLHYGEQVHFPPNTVCEIIVFAGGGIVSYDGIVLDSGGEGYGIKLTSSGEELQRRMFYRFSLVLPMSFYVVAENQSKLYNGIIKDIGTGGTRFVASRKMEVGTDLKCLLELGKEVIIAEGEIIAVRSFPKSNYKFQYRLKFRENEPNYNKIDDFIFSRTKRRII